MTNLSASYLEKFMSIPRAAKVLGIPAYVLRRAVKQGNVPGHKLVTDRLYVRLSEVEAAITGAQKLGGDNE